MAELIKQLLAAWLQAEKAAPDWIAGLNKLAQVWGVEDVADTLRAAVIDEARGAEFVQMVVDLAASAALGDAPVHPAVTAVRGALEALAEACVDAAMGQGERAEDLERLARAAFGWLSERLIEASLPTGRGRP